jgi:hypothetical protein
MNPLASATALASTSSPSPATGFYAITHSDNSVLHGSGYRDRFRADSQALVRKLPRICHSERITSQPEVIASQNPLLGECRIGFVYPLQTQETCRHKAFENLLDYLATSTHDCFSDNAANHSINNALEK